MPATTSHTLGRIGERLALEHYQRLGFTLLERNYRTRRGELDLIVRDDDRLVFVEVKTARAGAGDPFDSITIRKQRQVRSMACEWLGSHQVEPPVRRLRFDAVGVVIDRRGCLLALEQREDVI